MLLATLTSCEKWLEATSSTRIPADKLFETREGFTDALSGLYIALGDQYLYGGSTGFTTLDLATYPYIYESNNVNKAIQTHNYSHLRVKVIALNIWYKYYNAVANVNQALIQLENQRGVFTTDEEYKLVKGELLGLRAYIHLELMRLYGVCDPTGDNSRKKTIPYVVTFDKEPTLQKSYGETCQLLLSDIDEAISCLECADPIAGNISPDVYASINQDGYWSNRQSHLNYYALLGLKARLLQWTGDLDGAAEYARRVIDGAQSSALVSWVDLDKILSDKSSYSSDNCFSCEHIFSLEISNLMTLTGVLYATVSNVSSYRINDSFIDDVLYRRIDPQTGSLAGSEDVRGPLLWLRYSSTGYYSCKMMQDNSYTGGSGRFPMMRLSEMYYLVVEDCIANGDRNGALDMLNQVRLHRGITDNLPSDCDVSLELEKEYYREFINEGQLIYLLKHKQVTSSLNSQFELKATDLIFPYPDEEINYGRVQEL